MKKTTRIFALLLCLVLLFSVSVYAGDTEKEEREQTRDYVEATGDVRDSLRNKYSMIGYSTVVGTNEGKSYLQFVITSYADSGHTANTYPKYLCNSSTLTLSGSPRTYIFDYGYGTEDDDEGLFYGGSGRITKSEIRSGQIVYHINTIHQFQCNGASWVNNSYATPLV